MANSKYAVVTVSIGKLYTDIAKMTHPTIKAYADKICADFIVIDEVDTKYLSQKWMKFKLKEILSEYDRIIYMDTDIIVRPDTPNLFDIVPVGKFSAFNEGRYASRGQYLMESRFVYNEEIKFEDTNFYNTGVFVCDSCHRRIFRIPKNATESADEQSYLNLRLINDKIDMHELTFKFNRMSLMDKIIGKTRWDAFVIHYAGAPPEAMVPPENSGIKSIIEIDLEQWKKDAPDYKYNHKIQLFISAGMGDQICAEPAIRFMKKQVFPDAELTVFTHHPRLFQHLTDEFGIPVKTYDEHKGLPESSMILYACPDDDKSEHHLSHALFHPTDFAAMSMFKMTIPNHEKRITLRTEFNDIAEIYDIVGEPINLNKMILVHPGKWWASKTLPTEFWQEMIDKLAEEWIPKGYNIGIIGKWIDEKQGYLPVKCLKGVIDFRDVTSLGAFVTLIAQAEITITNDSSPVHIAGAFDNWLITFSTAKAADHILPFRYGTQYWKTLSLETKLLVNDLETRWTESNPDTIDSVPKGKTLWDYLPKVDVVTDNVRKILTGKMPIMPMLPENIYPKDEEINELPQPFRTEPVAICGIDAVVK